MADDGGKVVSGHVRLSISDDDLCATCANLDYEPGSESRCRVAERLGRWPATFDADGYAQTCPDHDATAAVAEA